MLGHDGLINAFPQAGNFAVQIFFALSGWLIGGILLNLSAADLPRFYFNRALRIWIPYFIAFVLLIAASLLREPVTSKWLEFVFYKLSFVYNLFGPPQLARHVQEMPLAGTGNHFWSVNAEEQFYLLAPLLLVLAAPRYGRHALTWLLIALAAWLSHIYASIVLGVLASVIASRHAGFQNNPGVRAGLWVLLAASSTALAMGGNYHLLAPGCAIAIVLLAAVAGRKHPLGVFAGGMSYPLYLNHWVGFFAAKALFKPFGLMDSSARHLLSFVLNIALAALLYWCIDRRVLMIRSQLYSPARGRLVIGAAYGMVIIGIGVGVTLAWMRAD